MNTISKGLLRASCMGLALAAQISLAEERLGTSELRWYSIDAGGTRVIANGYTLSATLGQPEPAVVATGTLELQAGFWNREVAQVNERLFRDNFE